MFDEFVMLQFKKNDIIDQNFDFLFNINYKLKNDIIDQNFDFLFNINYKLKNGLGI